MLSICCSMAATIKEIVSKNKRRFKDDSFDLDLSYITNKIIAMGYPAEALERLYRNSIDDVVKFFETKHKENYKIYNLCSEVKRNYDPSKFNGPVDQEYSFEDHNPPPFSMLQPFCRSVHDWMSSDPNHIVAVHCKAGKGRTGLMICAYLIHEMDSHMVCDQGRTVTVNNAQSALHFYGVKRTHDAKGVTIPSQQRYVYYYEDLVKRKLVYRQVPLRLTSLMLTSAPVSILSCSYTLICDIYSLTHGKTKIKTVKVRVKRGDSDQIFFDLSEEIILREDVKFEFYAKKLKKERLFEFCFNTFFVAEACAESYTLTTIPCDRCRGEQLWMLESPIINMGTDHSSVIDLSCINELRDEDSSCTCDSSVGSTVHTKSPSIHSKGDHISIHKNDVMWSMSVDSASENGSNPVASTSTALASDSKISSPTLSNYTSSSMSTDLPSTYKSPEKTDELILTNLFLVIPKEKLDKAYKDTSSKTFSSGFQAVLQFSTLHSNGQNIASASDTETRSQQGDSLSEDNVNRETISDHNQVNTSSSDSASKSNEVNKYRLRRIYL